GRPRVAEQALVASGGSEAVSCPENGGRRDNKHAGCIAKPGLHPISRKIGPRSCRKRYCTNPENCAEHCARTTDRRKFGDPNWCFEGPAAIRPKIYQIAGKDCLKDVACRHRQGRDRIHKAHTGNRGRGASGYGCCKNRRPDLHPAQENSGQRKTRCQRDWDRARKRQVYFCRRKVQGSSDQQLKDMACRTTGVQPIEKLWCRETDHYMSP